MKYEDLDDQRSIQSNKFTYSTLDEMIKVLMQFYKHTVKIFIFYCRKKITLCIRFLPLRFFLYQFTINDINFEIQVDASM